jgi:hypothetical protein
MKNNLNFEICKIKKIKYISDINGANVGGCREADQVQYHLPEELDSREATEAETD